MGLIDNPKTEKDELTLIRKRLGWVEFWLFVIAFFLFIISVAMGVTYG